MLVEVDAWRQQRVERVAASESAAEAKRVAAVLCVDVAARAVETVHAKARREIAMSVDVVPVRLAHGEGRRLHVVEVGGHADDTLLRDHAVPRGVPPASGVCLEDFIRRIQRAALRRAVGDEMRRTRRKTESVAAERFWIEAAAQQRKRISRFAQQDRLGRKRRGVRGDGQLHARDLFEEPLKLLCRVFLDRTCLFGDHDRVCRRLSARGDLKRSDAGGCKGGTACTCRQKEE